MSDGSSSKHLKAKGKRLQSKSKEVPMSLVGRRMLQEKFFHAIYTQNIPVIKKLIEKGANPNLESPEYLVSPIHILAQRDDAVLGYHLITSCSKINLDALTCHGFTAFHISCMLNKPKFVNLLLQHGADPNVPDKFGKTPLHYATENRHLAVIHKLIKSEKVNINVMDCFENTPLSISLLTTRDNSIAKALLQHGADMRLETERNLHIFFECILSSFRAEHIEPVMVLLNWGVDVNMIDRRTGQNCLHYVATTGFLELAVFLVIKGAKLHVLDNVNRTPAKTAEQHGNVILADYLRKGYRPPHLLTTLPLFFLWSSKLKARLQDNRNKRLKLSDSNSDDRHSNDEKGLKIS